MNYQDIENYISMGDYDISCSYTGNATGQGHIKCYSFTYDVEVKNGLVDFVNSIKLEKDIGGEWVEVDMCKVLEKTIIDFIEEELA